MRAMNDDIIFTWDDDPAQHEPYMKCEKCGAHLCTIEEGDSLGVIVGVAEDHVCNEAA
jgi:hypothetical protein